MVSLQVNEYVMMSNEIATEFCALVILKGSSAGEGGGEKTQYRIRAEKRGAEKGKRRRDTILNAAPSLSHTFSPQSIDEKVFAHVLRVRETERGLVVESFFFI